MHNIIKLAYNYKCWKVATKSAFINLHMHMATTTAPKITNDICALAVMKRNKLEWLATGTITAISLHQLC